MSQFSANRICRRIAELAQVAVPALSGKIGVGMPRTVQTAPKATVFCPKITRVAGFVGKNRYSYSVTLYLRLPKPEGEIDTAKDATAEALYAAIVPLDGVFLDSEGEALARSFNLEEVDRADYIEDGDRNDYSDLTLTFTCEADANR